MSDFEHDMLLTPAEQARVDAAAKWLADLLRVPPEPAPTAAERKAAA